MIIVDATIKFDLEDMQRRFTSEQITAVFKGLARIIGSSNGARVHFSDKPAPLPEPPNTKAPEGD